MSLLDDERAMAARNAATASLPANVAHEFSRVLHEQLGADTMREVVQRNALPEYARCCASHDFCDANVYMAEAFEQVTGRAPDPASDADAALWNEAWEIAKSEGFKS